jgi:transposase
MVCEQIKALEQARLANLEQAPGTGPHAMVRLIANVIGVGLETADMLVQEVLSRNLRDRRAVARFAGLTGAPNESGSRRRKRGLAKSGNARVRRGLIQLAWRFLRFQKDSALAQWHRARDRKSGRRAEDEDDRGARAKAAHRVLAHGHGRRNPSRLRVAAAGLRRSARKLKQAVRRPLGFSRMAVDDPRWR